MKSATVARDEVPLKDFVIDGTLTGRNGSYFRGRTPGTRKFETGRFVLRPGMEPHPAHQHPEEELLIVMTGTGVITCDGTTTDVAPGAVMYSAPHVMHGLKNTGTTDLEFLYIKWIGQSPDTPAPSR